MSTSANILQLKYKKIVLSDLTFDQGDSFFERGQFGDVKKAKWNDKVVAVKSFSQAERKCGFKEELVSLSLLQPHEHIVTMHGACSTGQPFIVLEFAPLSLEKVIHECKKMYSYTSEHVMSWSLQTAKGLEYIHSKKMLHRDIKPSNILLFHHGSKLKLCDFGTAKKLESTLSNMTNAVGTIRYMAPEVIKGKHYNDRCDIFSFGIVLWEMLSRRRPMPSQGNHFQVMFAMANGATPPKIFNLPRPISELIAKCFSVEPTERPSVTEIKKKLEYLSQFMKPCPPLIPRRKKRAKDEPTQSDVFVADKQGTQYHTPRVSADSAVEEDEKPVQVELVPDEGSADSAFQQDEVKAPIPSVRPLGSPKREVITSSQLSPQEGVRFIEPETEETKIRDRSLTVPERPSDIGEEVAQTHRRVLHPQMSSPATDEPSKYATPPRPHKRQQTTPEGSVTMRRVQSGRGLGHQESEYEEITVSEEFLSDTNLQVQSERYQIIEEVMKRTTNFPVADEKSPKYVITGLEPELQPILPNENTPQSMDLYHQYSAVAEDILRVRKEYDDLMDENLKLAREIESDRQKVAKQTELRQEYEKQCKLKDQLLSEYSRLDEQYKSLREKNSIMPSS